MNDAPFRPAASASVAAAVSLADSVLRATSPKAARKLALAACSNPAAAEAFAAACLSSLCDDDHPAGPENSDIILAALPPALAHGFDATLLLSIAANRILAAESYAPESVGDIFLLLRAAAPDEGLDEQTLNSLHAPWDYELAVQFVRSFGPEAPAALVAVAPPFAVDKFLSDARSHFGPETTLLQASAASCLGTLLLASSCVRDPLQARRCLEAWTDALSDPLKINFITASGPFNQGPKIFATLFGAYPDLSSALVGLRSDAPELWTPATASALADAATAFFFEPREWPVHFHDRNGPQPLPEPSLWTAGLDAAVAKLFSDAKLRAALPPASKLPPSDLALSDPYPKAFQRLDERSEWALGAADLAFALGAEPQLLANPSGPIAARISELAILREIPARPSNRARPL